jgi:hypothetical protein
MEKKNIRKKNFKVSGVLQKILPFSYDFILFSFEKKYYISPLLALTFSYYCIALNQGK